MESLILELSKQAVLTEAQDLPALVELQERFHSLRKVAEQDNIPALYDISDRAAQTIEQIVLREINAVDEAFAQVRESIEYVQAVADSVRRGQSGDEIPLPRLISGSEPIALTQSADPELIEAWVATIEDVLTELESTVMDIEQNGCSADTTASARRRIHTLKGECGVLSLGKAQHLCHETETLIDHALNERGIFPTEVVLRLVDWLRVFARALMNDPAAQAPDDSTVLAALSNESVKESFAGAPIARETADERAFEKNDDDQPIEFPADLATDENLGEFLCEAREHLSKAEECLLELDRDRGNPELINTVFRAFHTIKGVAGFMHLKPMVELAHSAEFLLGKARDSQITLDLAHLDLILRACDLMNHMLNVLEGEAPPLRKELELLVEQLKNATDGKPVVRRTSGASAHARDDRTHAFAPVGEILVNMQIVSAEQVDAALNEQAHHAGALRDVLIQAGLTDVDAVEAELLRDGESARKIRTMIQQLSQVSAEDLERAIAERRSSSKRLGVLLGLGPRELAPALREQRRIQYAPEAAPATESRIAATSGADRARRRVEQQVKVSTHRMDNLMDLVGELVIAHQMVIQDPEVRAVSSQRAMRNIAHVGKIIRDLQEVSTALRMVTLKATFQKMSRLVRDVSAQAGKKVNLHIEGEDTELDRNVVEEIADPLVHMIRNSCDHGIETSAERKRVGKSPIGNLWLRAYHQGGAIIIEIEDDGRGLDREMLLRKVIEKGLVDIDRDLSKIPDSEVYAFIFLPGFSTAEKVTEVSGRGVGMDVVRRNIEALRGKIEIDSSPGQGTTIRLRLPLTMAIIDGMVIRVGSQRFVIPTLSIVQSFRANRNEVFTSGGRGEMVNVRGTLLPVYRLNRVMNLHEGVDDVYQGIIIVLESHNSKCALMIDEILDQQQVVIKSLGQGMPQVRSVSGGAILGDGRVALILDVSGVIQTAIATPSRVPLAA